MKVERTNIGKTRCNSVGNGNDNVDGNGDDNDDENVERRQHAFTLQLGTLLTAVPDCSIQSRPMMTTLILLMVMMMTRELCYRVK